MRTKGSIYEDWLRAIIYKCVRVTAKGNRVCDCDSREVLYIMLCVFPTLTVQIPLYSRGPYFFLGFVAPTWKETRLREHRGFVLSRFHLESQTHRHMRTGSSAEFREYRLNAREEGLRIVGIQTGERMNRGKKSIGGGGDYENWKCRPGAATYSYLTDSLCLPEFLCKCTSLSPESRRHLAQLCPFEQNWDTIDDPKKSQYRESENTPRLTTWIFVNIKCMIIIH